MICPRCDTPIRPGQLYIRRKPSGERGPYVRQKPIHVACPTPEEIAHRKRMGRL